jgi:31-O-methyltransferase
MYLQRVTLPGPLGIWASNQFEADALYVQIVVDRTYERHGISIRAGDTIFDVGANIGLFALHMTRIAPGVQVHSFEPVPETFEALNRNLREHSPGVHAYNIGLAEKAGEATFELDRFATMSATMHPRELEKALDRTASLTTWASAALADFDRINPGRRWVRLARKGLERRVLGAGVLLALLPTILAMRIRRRLFLRRPSCRLQTLSHALSASGVDHVDLVKIDVEGAEEAVLAGIADQDWSRLRQFVIEVHDINGRVGRMTELLERRGYRTICERDDWETLRLMGISTIYAFRN